MPNEIDGYVLMVKRLAFRMKRRLARHVSIDDLISDGLLGLTQAMHNYDASRGASFKTHAYARIVGAMRDGIRSPMHWNRYRGTARVWTELRDVHTVPPNQETLTFRREAASRACRAARSLESRDRVVLRGLLRGDGQGRIGAALGLQVWRNRQCPRVSQLKARIFRRLEEFSNGQEAR